MSNAALNWAYEQTVAPGPKFVLVTLADVADDSGVTFRGQQFLVKATGFSRRTVVAHMAVLESAGLIARVARRRLNGSKTSDYTVLAPGGNRGSLKLPDPTEVPAAVVDLASGANPACADFACADSAHGHVQISHHQTPQKNPPSSPGERAGERADAPVKYRGKPVRPEAWVLTEQILSEFNAQAGRKLRLLTSAGEPSEAAKRIYGRVVTYPDIDLSQHTDIIRRTLASRWWWKGRTSGDPPSIGVVYGPNVFEENITREAAASASAAAADKADEKKRRAAEDLAAIRDIIEGRDE